MPDPTGTDTPLFSVVIPTYNRAAKLKRALDSLVAQTFRAFEVLVSDDGSDDGSREIVEQYADRLTVSYLWEENWGGPARPRNRGIAAARGEWVCFLDADDWWYPGKLQAMVKELHRADFIYHDFDIHSESGPRKVGKRSRQLIEPVFVDLMTVGCSLVTSSVCVKKDLLDQAGGFAEEKELIAIEDFDLWIKLARLTEKFLHIAQPLGVYWVDGANISTFSEGYIARETAVCRRYAGFLATDDRKEAERLLAYKTGVAKKYLGAFSECRAYFREAMLSRRPKIRLYARIYYLLSLFGSRYTIP